VEEIKGCAVIPQASIEGLAEGERSFQLGDEKLVVSIENGFVEIEPS